MMKLKSHIPFGTTATTTATATTNSRTHRQQQQQQPHSKRIIPTMKRFRYGMMFIAILLSVESIVQFFAQNNTMSRLLLQQPYRNLLVSDDNEDATTTATFNNRNSEQPITALQQQQKRTTNTNENMNDGNIVIDMISIGSITRADYQRQQQQTFGSHPAIRHFYPFHEHNDTSDPFCSTDLSISQVKDITTFCNTQWDTDDSTIRTWLRKRLKPFRYNNGSNKSQQQQSVGWMCAQKRPIDAIQFLLQHYRSTTSSSLSATTTTFDPIIPDYVVLIDDDTYINMEPFLLGLHNYTTSLQQQQEPLLLLGGCVFNFPRGLQFLFPHGGYGSILSKATIQNLLRPIDCSHYQKTNHGRSSNSHTGTTMDPFSRMACWRLYEQNHFGELQYFTNGMSVSDLMYNYTQSLSFGQVNEWVDGNGFCFHSDHALGYFLGFYHVAIPDTELQTAELSDTVRQQYPYGYSEISVTTTVNDDDDNGDVATTKTTTPRIPTNAINSQCTNSYYEQCNRDDMICHYIQPQQMKRMHVDNIYYEDEVRAKLQRMQSSESSFDVISIGTMTKPQLQDAQERTFGSHPSIRHWFRINEWNDTDTTCSSELTIDQINMVNSKCKTFDVDFDENNDDDTEIAGTPSKPKQSLASNLVRRRLFSPKNHTGWMCAQKRPIDGLYKAIKQYTISQQGETSGSNDNSDMNMTISASSSLPSYLVIIDDDTFMNMNYLMEALPTDYPSYESYAITGCRLTHPRRIQFTFPFGGFGTILTRRAIEHFIRPIHCRISATTTTSNGRQQNPAEMKPDDVFNAMACWRLDQNLFGEKSFFQDGMSVLDLMYAYSSGLLYTKVDEWKNGIDFCFHSDHALGYFIGYYHIAVTDERWSSLALHIRNDDSSNNRIEDYFNDELRHAFTYTGLKRDEINGCQYRGKKCTNDSPFCHYMDANQMDQLYNVQMAIQQ